MSTSKTTNANKPRAKAKPQTKKAPLNQSTRQVQSETTQILLSKRVWPD